MGKVEIFVNQEDMALFSCPHCGKIKHVSVAKFKNIKHTLQVKCVCGETFTADLNFRKKYRKFTNLEGFYCNVSELKKNADTSEMSRNCMVVNLSLGGLGFRPLDGRIVQQGDELIVDFSLDDKKQSRMVRKVVVRHVEENSYIGAEFIDDNQFVYDKILGFYLMV